MRDKEKARKYQREWWRKRHKKTEEEPKRTEFDQYSYRTVSSSWRDLVGETQRRQAYHLAEITSPLVIDLLKGKTCLVDYTVPYGSRGAHPFRTLYSYFQSRGLKLRVHMVDDTKNEKYRILLMWTEALKINRLPRQPYPEEELVA